MLDLVSLRWSLNPLLLQLRPPSSRRLTRYAPSPTSTRPIAHPPALKPSSLAYNIAHVVPSLTSHACLIHLISGAQLLVDNVGTHSLDQEPSLSIET